MSPEQQDQSPSKRPGRLVDTFDEDSPVISATTAKTTIVEIASRYLAPSYLAPAVVPINTAAPTGTVANSLATSQETDSTVTSDNIDPLLREKVLPVSHALATTRGDNAAISEQGAIAYSFDRIYAMGFDGKKVLLALLATDGDVNLAVEYLLNSSPQKEVAEVGLSSGAGPQGQESMSKDDNDSYREPNQEQIAQQMVLSMRSRGIDEKEIAKALAVFEGDRVAALDLGLAGPSSARVTAPSTPALTTATAPPPRRTFPPHLSAPYRSPTLHLNALSIRPSSHTLGSQPKPTSRVADPDYISPFTNGYVPTVIDPSLSDLPPSNKSLKRPRENTSITATPDRKQKKRPQAPTPPRRKVFTRKEMRRRMQKDKEDEKTRGMSQE